MRTMKILSTIGTLLILGLYLASSSSCKKEDECEYPNLTSADINGNVNLFDDFEEPLDKSGMVVSILYTNPIISDTTDENGNYSLKNVDFGNYTLSYSKQGYGTYLTNFAHRNECQLANQVPQYFLGQRSTTTITSLSVQPIVSSIKIDVTINPAGTDEQPRYYRLFFKNQNDVSNSSYDVQSGLLVTNTNAGTTNLSIGDLHGLGFQPGETIYVKAYGDSFYSNDYFDLDQDEPIILYPNTNIVTVPDVEFVTP